MPKLVFKTPKMFKFNEMDPWPISDCCYYKAI